MKRLTLILTLAVTLLQGCATVAVDRAKDLSSAAISYSEATVAVVDLALDAAIDADSRALVITKPRQPVTEEEQRQRTKDLEESDVLIAQTVSLYTSLRQSVNTTRAYFVALQNLAHGAVGNESFADAAGSAVQSVANRVKAINDALGRHSKLNDATASAVGGLAKLVAAQVHGAIVAKALERDADIIGRAFELQHRVLLTTTLDVSAKHGADRELFIRDRVRKPYATGVIGPEWIDDRRIYLKLRALGETNAALGAAQTAAAQMQVVWQRILRGEYSAQEILAVLKETEDLLGAIQLLKNATKS